MAPTNISCFWNQPEVAGCYRAAVSLHSHSNHSKESLFFIPRFTEKWGMLQWALTRQCKRSPIPVDLVRAYWTPPVTAKSAFELERDQIENVLGLMCQVSITDHDTIEAPALLRALPETTEVPFSLEWTVAFEGAIFHLGVHNLPSGQAQAIMADLAACTQSRSDRQLSALMAMLDEAPEVLVVLNHPFWDLCGIGQQRHQQVLHRFLERNAQCVHAFELNAMRGRRENNSVIELAGRWQRLLVSGGDRHGREPSGALNLTAAQTFSEFVRELRQEQRSHVLFMPQYAEPLTMRTTQVLLDVIREYPEYADGCRRWDDRVYHPSRTAESHQPLSSLWNAPPSFIERIFSAIRLLENGAVQRALTHVLRDERGLQPSSDIAPEGTL